MKLLASFEQGKISSPVKVILEGLFIQGCGFDGVWMTDLNEWTPQTELTSLPPCEIAWVGKSTQNPYGENATVNTPVYFNISRENLLCKLDIPNQGRQESRIIGGTAIFLASD